MLEYIFLLRGNHSFQVPGLDSPSVAVRLAILNGFFLLLYVIRRIFGASPLPAGLMILAVLAMLIANVLVGLQPDLGTILETLTGRF